MNGDAAVSLVMFRLGNRTEASLREIVTAEMEIVQSDLLTQLDFRPWFLQASAPLATVAADETLALPSDFSDLMRIGVGCGCSIRTSTRAIRM